MPLKRVVMRALLSAMAVAGSWREVRAGCTAVGTCGRIDWTEPIATDGTDGTAVEFHGAFAWHDPSWDLWLGKGHFVAQCSPAAPAECQTQLDALLEAARTQTPLWSSSEETFMWYERRMPPRLIDGMDWPAPAPGRVDDSYCRRAFGLPRNQPCPGDCDHSGTVTVDEVIFGIRMVVESLPADGCSRMDVNGDDAVTVDEVVQGLHAAVQDCP